MLHDRRSKRTARYIGLPDFHHVMVGKVVSERYKMLFLDGTFRFHFRVDQEFSRIEDKISARYEAIVFQEGVIIGLGDRKAPRVVGFAYEQEGIFFRGTEMIGFANKDVHLLAKIMANGLV